MKIENNVNRLQGMVNELAARCINHSDEVTAELAGMIGREAARVIAHSKVENIMPKFIVPMHLLDTPTNRRYLAALEVAYSAGIEVDFERGYEDGEGVAEQEVANLLSYTRAEIHAPTGSGE